MILTGLAGKMVKIDRSKGLGENDPDMMWLTTMNPETRRLIKVMPEDAAATAAMFDLLLVDNLQGRKDHIAENGYKLYAQKVTKKALGGPQTPFFCPIGRLQGRYRAATESPQGLRPPRNRCGALPHFA